MALNVKITDKNNPLYLYKLLFSTIVKSWNCKAYAIYANIIRITPTKKINGLLGFNSSFPSFVGKALSKPISPPKAQ